jgi:serine/threonine-protein kinase HipA
MHHASALLYDTRELGDRIRALRHAKGLRQDELADDWRSSMARRSLNIWLHGVHTARLSEPTRFRYRLDFTDDALDAFGEGSRVLSLSLPIGRKPFVDNMNRSTDLQVSAFVEGLLPEGNLRQHIAASAGVPVTDSMELLARVGAECAGAVQILEAGIQPGPGHVRRLTDDEVTRLVADLPTYHLPDGATTQASLAGIQDKVLLTALDDGRWGWPEQGAPSTHIVKPEPLGGSIPQLVQTEDWALNVARTAGLASAESRLATFDQREAIIVTRYDRDTSGQRLHQEDFCQAIGLAPQAKYESTAEANRYGSRLTRIAHLAAARAEDPDAFRAALLRTVTFNVAIGNGDAHSKNYSLMIDRVGRVSLAPIYDSAPTAYLDAKYKGTGHVINGKTSIDTIAIDDLTAEAASWGMSARRAKTIATSCMHDLHDVINAVALPPGAESVKDNLEAMWARRSWPV